MSAVATTPLYLRVSKTFMERLARYLETEPGRDPQAATERLLSLGLMVMAMPDGATIVRKRGAIMGVDTPDPTTRPKGANSDDEPIF